MLENADNLKRLVLPIAQPDVKHNIGVLSRSATPQQDTKMDFQSVRRRAEAARQLGLSVRTLDRWERAGAFPKRIQLGGRAVGYVVAEIESWLAQRRRKS